MNEEIIKRIDQLMRVQDHILVALSSLTSKETTMPMEWYDSADIKRMLNISSATLFRLRKSKTIQAAKISGKWFYKLPDFNKFIAAD